MPDGPSYLFKIGDNVPLTYVIIVILVLFGAIFSASETALASCNRIRMKVKADDDDKMARIVCKILDKFDNMVYSLIIGNNIVSVFVSSISTLLFIKLLPESTDSVVTVVATVVTTAICFIFCDTLPKSIARKYPDSIAKMGSWFIYFIMIITWPLAKVFQGINFLVGKIFHIKEEPTLTEEDFSNIIDSIEEEGILEESESEIIQNSLEFGDTFVKDVLTPREKMFAINIDEITHESLNKIILETPYSRIPVYKKDIDHIIGILVVKSYLKSYFNNKKVSIKSTLTKVYFVSPSITMDELLEGFNRQKTHIAIVRDGDNKTLGMVTMEDMLDELVGENVSEWDFYPKKRGDQ